MFNNEEEFNRLVSELGIDTRVDPAHKELVRRRMLEQHAQGRQSPSTGRMARSIGWARRLSVKTKSLAALAAVLLITAGILAVVYYGAGAKIALADVQRKLAAAPVVAFRLVSSGPGVTTTEAQSYVTQDSITRFEGEEYTTVIDWPQGKMMAVLHEPREVIVGNIQNLETNPYHRDWLAELRRIVGNENARRLGEQTVDGIKAVGWQIDDGDWLVTVWADAGTAELVQVIFTCGEVRMAFSQFRYDVDVDEAMFSLAPPEGYTALHVTIDAGADGEAEVVTLLRIWAVGCGNVFPETLDAWKFSAAANRVDWEAFQQAFPDKIDEQVSQDIAQAFWWLNANPGWSYVGAGVRLGDAKAPVLYYQPKGSGTYRIIYGDLHVETADAPPR